MSAGPTPERLKLALTFRAVALTSLHRFDLMLLQHLRRQDDPKTIRRRWTARSGLPNSCYLGDCCGAGATAL